MKFITLMPKPQNSKELDKHMDFVGTKCLIGLCSNSSVNEWEKRDVAARLKRPHTHRTSIAICWFCVPRHRPRLAKRAYQCKTKCISLKRKDIENETGESTKPAGISHEAFQISADMQSINIQLECVMFCFYIFAHLWLQTITVLLLLAASSGSLGLQSRCVPTHHSTNTNGDSHKLKLHTSMCLENRAHYISCPSIFFFHRLLSF